MFFRVKSAGSYQYLQIVHSVREGEKVRQQVFGTLGRPGERVFADHCGQCGVGLRHGEFQLIVWDGSSARADLHLSKLATELCNDVIDETTADKRFADDSACWPLRPIGQEITEGDG